MRISAIVRSTHLKPNHSERAQGQSVSSSSVLNRRKDDPTCNQHDTVSAFTAVLKRITVALLKHVKGLPRYSSPSARQLRDGLGNCIEKLQAIDSAQTLQDLEIQIKKLIRLQSEQDQMQVAEQYYSIQRLLGSVSQNLVQLKDTSVDGNSELEHHFENLSSIALLDDPKEMSALFYAELAQMRTTVREKMQTERDIMQRLYRKVAALESELAAANKGLVYDTLTETYNRRAFDDRLEEAIRDHTADGGIFSLLLCDIDHFKKVNDSHGHLIGDRALRAMGQAAKSCFRDEDLVARYGGEEFGILLASASIQYAQRAAERFRLTVARKEFQYLESGKMRGLKLTVSIGVASFRSGDTSESLVKRADQALYAAKHQGRNRIMLESDITESETSPA